MRLLLACAAVAALTCAVCASRPAQGSTIDESLILFPVEEQTVHIAPMTRAGDPSSKGAYSPASRSGVFSAILARSGIRPGVTLPKDLQGRDGFLEFIDQSIVLNEGGTRATFGYFLSGEGTNKYFVLFSYDHISVKDGEKETSIFAFEVFVFGDIDGDDAGRLIRGEAVGVDGRLLSEVPLALARVSNVKGKDYGDETVKPGFFFEGKGCLLCHARKKGDAQATLPFPWIRPNRIDPCLVGKWEAKTVTAITDLAKPTGGEGFLVTFERDGTQTVDYAKMKPFEWDRDKGYPNGHIYRGTAKGVISTAAKSAKVERMVEEGVTLEIYRGGSPPERRPKMKLPSLGPGGLGTTASDNGYVCTDQSLEYKTSVAVDRRPTHALKLVRLKD